MGIIIYKFCSWSSLVEGGIWHRYNKSWPNHTKNWFIECRSTDTAVDVTSSFFSNFLNQQELLGSIVLSRVSSFPFEFWEWLTELWGIKLNMFSSCYSQTGSASRIMKRAIENYRRSVMSYHQSEWDELLASAETAYHFAESRELGILRFELDLGWNPETLLSLITRTKGSAQTLRAPREWSKAFIRGATFFCIVAKSCQAAGASRRITRPEYKDASKLWIGKLIFKDTHARFQNSDSLSAKRFGTLVITKLTGKGAAKARFSPHCKIHPVIYVNFKTPCLGQSNDTSQSFTPELNPVPTVHGIEHVVEIISYHRRKERGYQILTLTKIASQQGQHGNHLMTLLTLMEPLQKFDLRNINRHVILNRYYWRGRQYERREKKCYKANQIEQCKCACQILSDYKFSNQERTSKAYSTICCFAVPVWLCFPERAVALTISITNCQTSSSFYTSSWYYLQYMHIVA